MSETITTKAPTRHEGVIAILALTGSNGQRRWEIDQLVHVVCGWTLFEAFNEKHYFGFTCGKCMPKVVFSRIQIFPVEFPPVPDRTVV